MNVREDSLRHYLEVFHQTYIDTAEKYIPQERLSLLLRYSLIKGRTIGYVSTQFGAGYEYVDADVQAVEVQVSSARIEDFFNRAPNRVRRLPTMFPLGANCGIASLTIEGAFPFRLASPDAFVRLFDVRFKALGWQRIVKFAELYGNRTTDFWSETNAVRRAKDEILIALVDLNQAAKKSTSLEEYLRTFKQQHVLILGDFSEAGRQRLNSIRQILADLGYIPILVDEVPDDLHYNLTQKATAIASVARFVVIDDSSKAGHLVEFSHVQSNNWTTIVLRLDGSEGTFMTKGASSYSKVIVEEIYTFSNLDQILGDSVEWAEKTISELGRASQEIYPWRKNEKNNQ
jgi:hypothetical protein